MSETVLRQLPLHAAHEAAGARFAPVAGWNMPVWDSNIRDEHLAVRRSAGIFDVSHMGEVFVRGPRALAAVDRLMTNAVGTLAVGRAMYTLLCHEHGGVVDDLIVYRLADDEVLICVNASNRAKDAAWITERIGSDAEVADESDQWAQLALQGPDAVARAVALAPALGDVARFGCARVTIAGVPCIAARTGYTGEDGFEFYVPADAAGPVLDALRAGDEVPLIGLGARDSLRTEARLPLYGHELADDINPYEAGLGWAVKLDGRQFVGRDALAVVRAEGPRRRLRGLLLEGRAMVRQGFALFAGDSEVGVVTSGTLRYAVDEAPIGLAFLDAAHADANEVEVDIRGRRVPARVTRDAFVSLRKGGV